MESQDSNQVNGLNHVDVFARHVVGCIESLYPSRGSNGLPNPQNIEKLRIIVLKHYDIVSKAPHNVTLSFIVEHIIKHAAEADEPEVMNFVCNVIKRVFTNIFLIRPELTERFDIKLNVFSTCMVHRSAVINLNVLRWSNILSRSIVLRYFFIYFYDVLFAESGGIIDLHRFCSHISLKISEYENQQDVKQICYALQYIFELAIAHRPELTTYFKFSLYVDRLRNPQAHIFKDDIIFNDT